MSHTNHVYDVVIMGGGLAGLSLSIQLKRTNPQLQILVAERSAHPPPDAAFKVGESTIEGAAHYFRKVLGLQDYLESEHLIKPGLRFYFSEGENRDITSRVELGDSTMPTWVAYQIDRGRFERELAERARDHGVEFIDRCRVKSIEIADPQHTVGLVRDSAEWDVRAPWIVDASGRFSLLKRQLGLSQDVAHQTINAVWFRMKGKIDIGSWGSNPDWQGRVDDPDYRWLSTNHLMGEGYWVWLIPLGEEYTSIGIVADERCQPLSEFSSFDKAMAWLKEHEPRCHAAVAERGEHCDFKVLKKLAFGCKQMYSADRWCLLGNAGVFHDPFYSPGSDVISWNNTYVTSLVEADLAGQDITSLVERYNNDFFDYLVEPLFRIYEDKYLMMANSQVFIAKVIWDDYWYWAVPCLLFFQDKLTDLDFMDSIGELIDRSNALSETLQAMFLEWLELDAGSTTAGKYVDLADFDTLTKAHDDMGEVWSDDELRSNIATNVALLEDLAKEMFWHAVRALADPPQRCNINPYAISLNPQRWEDDGLFLEEPEGQGNLVLQTELTSLWFEPAYCDAQRVVPQRPPDAASEPAYSRQRDATHA